jgi:predicted transposase YbfD/YdcC
VNAWAVTSGLVLGQRKVDGKTNEITAILELLRLLNVSGAS